MYSIAMSAFFHYFSFFNIVLAFLFSILTSMLYIRISNSNLPPGPWKFPLIGNLHQLLNGSSIRHHCMTDLAKKYGPIMHVSIGQIPTVVISSPEVAIDVLKTNELNFAQRPLILSYQVAPSGLIGAVYGEHWRHLRKVSMLELFSVKRVRSFTRVREQEVSNLIESISSSKGLSSINLSSKIFAFTTTMISRTAFGKMYRGQDVFLTLLPKTVTLNLSFHLPYLFPSLKFLGLITGLKTTMNTINQIMDKILDDIIHDHKSQTKPTTIKNGKPEDVEDLLGVLLRVQKGGDLGIEITDDHIKSILTDLLSAGTETTAITIEWAMSELIKNPRVMEKAQAEVRMILKGKEKIDEIDTTKLEYLKLVIQETLRLHPPVPIFNREARERCKINGYDIPAKTLILVNTWAMGRDPKLWTDPECFQPERFHGSSIDFKGTYFEFTPFGAGRRICPGISFASANMELVLSQLLYHFDWKLPNDKGKVQELDMEETSGLTVRRKNDLHLIAIPYILSH